MITDVDATDAQRGLNVDGDPASHWASGRLVRCRAIERCHLVPAGRSGDGLPIGLQIAAPHYAEDELIHFGTLVERLGATFAPPRGYE